MSPHLTRDDAARWTAGLLDGEAARALEAHAAACPACEALLQAEARTEAQLVYALRTPAASNVVALPRRRRRVVVALAVSALALAASLWVVFSAPPPPPPTPSLMALVDAGAAAAPDDFSVPRYEDDAVVPPEALSAFQPLDF